MAYSDFTIFQLNESFGLQLREEQPVFPETHEQQLPAHLSDLNRHWR